MGWWWWEVSSTELRNYLTCNKFKMQILEDEDRDRILANFTAMWIRRLENHGRCFRCEWNRCLEKSIWLWLWKITNSRLRMERLSRSKGKKHGRHRGKMYSGDSWCKNLSQLWGIHPHKVIKNLVTQNNSKSQFPNPWYLPWW